MAHSDRQKAEALAILDACGGNVKEASRRSGIAHKTLDDWSKKRHVNGDVAEIRKEIKKDLAAALEDVARELVGAMPGKVADATLQQIAMSMAITIDKMQLLKGEPTGINESRNAEPTDRDRAARIFEVFNAGAEKTA